MQITETKIKVFGLCQEYSDNGDGGISIIYMDSANPDQFEIIWLNGFDTTQ